MPDRVRESIFDILASWYELPGHLPPIRVADMFAGSGSLGLESLSRGATTCDFIERSPRALQTLRRNIATLSAGKEACVIRANAWTCALVTPRPDEPYGVIFLDPPYADVRDTTPTGRVQRVLNDLHRARWAADGTCIVLHHEKQVCLKEAMGGPWRIRDRREYGSTGITFVVSIRPTSDETDPPIRNLSGEERSTHA